jgi:hypothetical protein
MFPTFSLPSCECWDTVCCFITRNGIYGFRYPVATQPFNASSEHMWRHGGKEKGCVMFHPYLEHEISGKTSSLFFFVFFFFAVR